MNPIVSDKCLFQQQQRIRAGMAWYRKGLLLGFKSIVMITNFLRKKVFTIILYNPYRLYRQIKKENLETPNKILN